MFSWFFHIGWYRVNANNGILNKKGLNRMNKFCAANEYTWLCDNCKGELNKITQSFNLIINELPDIYSSDDEYPCNFMYDNKLFCGGYTCINGIED